MKYINILGLLATVMTVSSNSTTPPTPVMSPPVDKPDGLVSRLIAAVNVLIVQESSDKILLVEEHQSSDINVVFKLPTIISLFEHCNKEDLETIKSRIDADSEYQQIENSAIHLRESFLAELRRENGYSSQGNASPQERDRRTTVPLHVTNSVLPETVQVAAPTITN
jgi:hypothetical protein